MIRHLTLTLLLVALCCAPAHAVVTFDWALVGNPGNAPDPSTAFGAVDYVYRISKHEVTNEQYVEFLNAVDPSGSNTLGFFNTQMASEHSGIERTGNDDGNRYLVKSGWNRLPVTGVTYFDALRFINWLHNGQGSGDTETGAYDLLGNTPIPTNASDLLRNPDATIWMPNENEWYKPAYHNSAAGTSGQYFVYATGSDSAPISDKPDENPAAVNYYNNDRINNGFNDGYAATGTTAFTSLREELTEVGAYYAAESPYDTFDQNGNVYEWFEQPARPELNYTGKTRGGGYSNLCCSFDTNLPTLASDGYGGFGLSFPYSNVGFRVASRVPAPSTATLLALACIAWPLRCVRVACKIRTV